VTGAFARCYDRFHKDPYGTDDGDFLGPAQWQWLENELSTSSAAFNIIVSGIQILPQDRFYGGENWHRFPAQRQRLINLILMANVKGVILLR
jgi:alkaline phosphatase D